MTSKQLRELIGEEVIERFFLTHFIPDKYKSKLPDGIYDTQEMDCKCREIVIDGCTIYRISSMWLDKGGPKDLPEEFCTPWGSYKT